jgi:hypothetical protein
LQLRYKQLTCGYGIFYFNHLKVATKSIYGYIGGVINTNKLDFKKKILCENEQWFETGQALKTFVELVGIPAAMH